MRPTTRRRLGPSRSDSGRLAAVARGTAPPRKYRRRVEHSDVVSPALTRRGRVDRRVVHRKQFACAPWPRIGGYCVGDVGGERRGLQARVRGTWRSSGHRGWPAVHRSRGRTSLGDHRRSRGGIPIAAMTASRQWMAESDAAFEELRPLENEYRDLGDRVLALGRFHARGRESGLEIDSPIAWIYVAGWEAGQGWLPELGRSPRSRRAVGVGDVGGERRGRASKLELPGLQPP